MSVTYCTISIGTLLHLFITAHQQPPPFQVGGTRGDVQPATVVGAELKRQGHRVRLATHEPFRQMVASAGLEFYPLAGDPVRWMQLTLDWR